MYFWAFKSLFARRLMKVFFDIFRKVTHQCVQGCCRIIQLCNLKEVTKAQQDSPAPDVAFQEENSVTMSKLKSHWLAFLMWMLFLPNLGRFFFSISHDLSFLLGKIKATRLLFPLVFLCKRETCYFVLRLLTNGKKGHNNGLLFFYFRTLKLYCVSNEEKYLMALRLVHKCI